MPINRRQFLSASAASGAAFGLGLTQTARAAASPNEQVTLGVMGLSRGLSVARTFAELPHCVVKTACDVDAQRAARGAETLTNESGHAAEPLGDFRHMLDDPDIDAVILALPVHWHAPAAIMALQAGKHVYVEKPCCHSPAEGELLVQAAREYGKAVQMGNQRRSWPKIQEAMDRLHAGELGRVYYSRGWYSGQRGSIGHGQAAPVPDHLDYDLWQGPAPRVPYKDNLVHYNWHWHWHWGTGELGNNGVHALDLCRWGLGVDYPTRVTSSGGRYHFDDDQETPDTHVVAFDFDGGKSISWDGLSCVRPAGSGAGFGASFHGEGGSLVIEGGNYTLYDRSGAEMESAEGPSDDSGHAANFLDAIRNDAPLSLNSEIAEGYKSTLLPLLGNIAQRTGDTLNCGANGQIQDNPAAEAQWTREYESGWEVKL